MAAGTACLLFVFAGVSGRVKESKTRRILVANTIRTLGAMLWPLVLLESVHPEDRSNSKLLLPLTWNFFAWGMDSYIMNYAPSSNPDRAASLRLEPTSITALTFGLCSLVGARPNGKHTSLFLKAILGCIILVLPSHTMAPNTMEEQMFESIQKAAIIWCIGLLIAGVVLSSGDQNALSGHF